ncbi:MAG: type I-U CRISPR-associated protein Cas7 [Gammaproteobacteria bacterium]|nr:type I-U CRISPR-associated protein Cas7 [Gammaproteobacteria bacterium]
MFQLQQAIANDAAIRRVQRLQPVGGAGDKVFPPTYPGEGRNPAPRHVFERRQFDGQAVWTVLVDSVQSQANRLEEALLRAARDGLRLPYVTVDFGNAGLQPITEVTSLDAPHRIYDAILRDSLHGEEPFMQSTEGRRVAAASPADATALFELSPTALLFGAWHSQGEGGGLGAKFARVLVSEVMGIDVPVDETEPRSGEVAVVSAARRTGSRLDPLGILRGVEVFKSATDWSTDRDTAGEKARPVRPSEVNHGNIAPTIEPLGVTCAFVEHRAVLSLAGLRRLHFGGEERSAVAREMLALLALIALAGQDAQGYALRSRCDLVPEAVAPMECVHVDGTTDPVPLDPGALRERYDDAYERATEAGFRFRSLRLTPQPKLVEVVRRSRKLALG